MTQAACGGNALCIESFNRRLYMTRVPLEEQQHQPTIPERTRPKDEDVRTQVLDVGRLARKITAKGPR